MNKYLTKVAGLVGLEPATLKVVSSLGTLAIGGGVYKSHLKNKSDERRQAKSDASSIRRTLAGRLSPEEAAKRASD